MPELPPEAPLLDDVYFLRRARVSAGDLWAEAVDWAPTVLTAATVLLVPHLMSRFLDAASQPDLFAGSLLAWLVRDRVVRIVVGLSLLALVSLWLWQVLELALERRRRIVRMDLHEIECWPGGATAYVPVRDIVGAQVGKTEQRSRWWVLRAPRHAVVLFVKRPGEQQIDRLRFDFSRHELVATSPASSPWAALSGVPPDQDGNRVAVDVIALLRRRRVTLSLPVEELPELDVDITADSGVRLVGNRDQMVLHLAARSITIPGWAVRSAQVITSAQDARSPLQLALELDPRCGEFHLLVGLGKGAGDAQIVQWCQLLAARFDKESSTPRSRP